MKATAATIDWCKQAVERWQHFWFEPTLPGRLHMTRIAVGCAVIGSYLPLQSQVDQFFGLHGWFDQQAYVEARALGGNSPVHFGWSVFFLAGTNSIALHGVFWSIIAVTTLFTFGVLPRLTGILSWIGLVSLSANPALHTDANAILLPMSFYMAMGYFLYPSVQPGWQTWSGPITVWPLGQCAATEDWRFRWPIRLTQVHFALAVLASGLHKLQFGDWWAGVALWYPLNPAGATSVAAARSHADNAISYLRGISVIAYMILIWQIGFPFFAWRSAWRFLVIGGGIVGLIGSSYLYGEPDFGLAFLAGCLSFIDRAEWTKWRDRSRNQPAQTEVVA